MLALCKKSIKNFVEGELYEVVQNHTNVFVIQDGEGDQVKFSKLYKEEHQNFREYFEIR